MTTNACVKNRGPTVYLKSKANSPHLQGKKRSSQPSSELSSSEGCLVAEKVEERGRKWSSRKRGERAESFPPKKTFINEGDVLTVSSLGAFIAKTLYKITKNNIENTIMMGVKKEENQKSQKAKTGSRKSRMNSGKTGEQWQQRHEQWQGGNFASCKNFSTLQNLLWPFSYVFYFSFLLDLQC